MLVLLYDISSDIKSPVKNAAANLYGQWKSLALGSDPASPCGVWAKLFGILGLLGYNLFADVWP